MIRTRTLAASLFAALAASTPLAGNAADLYGENYRYDDSQGYDEGRQYGESNRGRENGYAEEEPRYDEPRYGYRGSTKDGDYLPPVDRAPPFSEYRPDGRYDNNGCAPRWQVRSRMVADGWRNFQRLAVRPNVIILRAQRPNGRAFDLKVDRCSGEVIAQRPARFQGYGAYGPRPHRYGWAY